MKFLRIYLIIGAALALVLVSSEPAAAQCAMCKSVLENSVDAAGAARGMNLAALVLLIPPVTIFSGLFYAIYRFRDVHGGSSSFPAEQGAFPAERGARDHSSVEPRVPDC